MDSALTPREMQARIRSGSSPEEVAQVAGTSVEKIDAFVAPVLAERDYIATCARRQYVRRDGQTVLHQTLGDVVAERLQSRGVDENAIRWDAWKCDGRKWTVQVAYDSGKAHREALFVYDQDGRFSIPANDDACWLLGLHSASHGPQPGRRRHGDAEPTIDLNDDIALVRVVQPSADDDQDEPADVPAPRAKRRGRLQAVEPDDAEDAYAESELAEVDGVLDFIPAQGSQMDVLYDMLSTFNEDSVQIYTGLIKPDQADLPTPPVEEEPPAAAPTTPAPEADQPSLIDSAKTDEEPPARKPKARKHRAKVPSWDEIVFGSPKGQ